MATWPTLRAEPGSAVPAGSTMGDEPLPRVLFVDDEPELLASLLADMVRANARAAGAAEALEVKVRPELVSALQKAVPALLGRALGDGAAGLDLKGELRAAGFEVRVADAVVEVSPESVAEKLVQLVSPQLRSLLRAAAGEARPLVAAG